MRDRAGVKRMAVRVAARHRDDVLEASRREAERSARAYRIRELGERLRVPAYEGRSADLEELDTLWDAMARTAP